ncbi:hypothetical protein G5I_07918 [Acromyrmex echinatior]|uniref:Uncharacterized protein n=1 Tax=Acromyrmex echinatior TaxID=103372 RepID=F4WQ58_ACREC|nr:hypothetical protein G5I_07918 [Acromyrmex echinatior]
MTTLLVQASALIVIHRDEPQDRNINKASDHGQQLYCYYEICNVPLKMGNFVCGSPYCTVTIGYRLQDFGNQSSWSTELHGDRSGKLPGHELFADTNSAPNNDSFTSSKSSENTRFLTVNLTGRHNTSYKIRNTNVVTDIHVS